MDEGSGESGITAEIGETGLVSTSEVAGKGVVAEPHGTLDVEVDERVGIGKAEYEARVGRSRSFVLITTVPVEPADDIEPSEDLGTTSCSCGCCE